MADKQNETDEFWTGFKKFFLAAGWEGFEFGTYNQEFLALLIAFWLKRWLRAARDEHETPGLFDKCEHCVDSFMVLAAGSDTEENVQTAFRQLAEIFPSLWH